MLDYLERSVLGEKDRAAVLQAVAKDLLDISITLDPEVVLSAERLPSAVTAAHAASFAANVRANASKVAKYLLMV